MNRIFITTILSILIIFNAFAEVRLQSDSIVVLNGYISSLSNQNDIVAFRFTGSFSYNTYPSNVQKDHRLELKFDVKDIYIEIPAFGNSRTDEKYEPYGITYNNVIKHSNISGGTKTKTEIYLFTPKLSFNSNGKLIKINCTHAQIIPDTIRK